MDTTYLITDEQPYDVAVLLATRGRTTSLELAIKSIVSRAANKDKIEILLAFDRDDYIGYGYFNENIKSWLISNSINYKIAVTERYGYKNLNLYYNLLSGMAQSNWLLAYNDDAIMETQGWDKIISSYTNQFKILAVHTHNEHPYSIFTIIPHIWYKIMGKFSRHQMFDAEISQMAYLLDIFQKIPVYIRHDRADLTGNNKDQTYHDRELREGNINDPRDFNHTNYRKKRIDDMQRLAEYMRAIGADISWWDSCVKGENKEPFAKLAANDPNKQVNIGNEFKKQG